jgi:hypothetical protein
MTLKLQVNRVVVLNSAKGRIERVIVEDLGDVISVCRAEELQAARIQERAPAAIGFRKSDIVEYR